MELLYFEYVSFIGHIELVVHRCLWTAVMLIITTTFLTKWKFFLKEIKNVKKIFALFLSGLLILLIGQFGFMQLQQIELLMQVLVIS